MMLDGRSTALLRRTERDHLLSPEDDDDDDECEDDTDTDADVYCSISLLLGGM